MSFGNISLGWLLKGNLLLLTNTDFMTAKMIKNENYSPFLGSKKMKKQKMAGVFIIETRKMSGTSKENIGQVMKKPRPNFLQKLLKNYWNILVKKMI